MSGHHSCRCDHAFVRGLEKVERFVFNMGNLSLRDKTGGGRGSLVVR